MLLQVLSTDFLFYFNIAIKYVLAERTHMVTSNIRTNEIQELARQRLLATVSVISQYNELISDLSWVFPKELLDKFLDYEKFAEAIRGLDHLDPNFKQKLKALSDSVGSDQFPLQTELDVATLRYKLLKDSNTPAARVLRDKAFGPNAVSETTSELENLVAKQEVWNQDCAASRNVLDAIRFRFEFARMIVDGMVDDEIFVRVWDNGVAQAAAAELIAR